MKIIIQFKMWDCHPCGCLDWTSTSCCLYGWLSKVVIYNRRERPEEYGNSKARQIKDIGFTIPIPNVWEWRGYC